MNSIESLREIFIKYLDSESFKEEPKNLYEPNNYFLQIGGKRLRPTLLLLSTELFGGDIFASLPAALSIEYFHNFTLIHDDVMDNAPVRRGFKTVHTKYNLNTAILSGDVLLVKGFQYLSKLDERHLKTIFDIYTKTAVEVCEGQQLDIDFETQEQVSHDVYIEMIRLKTSVLLAASMQIGAILGNATIDDANLIYQYAENLGLAFQIQDDILDCFGEEALVGKQPGGDIIQNKKTILLIEALKRCDQNNDVRLKEWIAKKSFSATEKVAQVKAIFEQYQLKEYGISVRNSYVQQAMKALENIQLSEERKTVLESLVEHLVVREF